MSNFLTFELQRKAEWRDRKAERHPEDTRNAAAADLLRKLADDASTSEAAGKLSRIEEDVDHEWYDRFKDVRDDVLADIGFRFHPQSVDHVAEEILAKLPDA